MIPVYIENVVNWLVDTDDNILKALWMREFDDIALKYLGSYVDDIDVELLLYCLDNGNEKFLKGALKLSAFDKLLFRDPRVINNIINLLKSGYRINFLLNVLNLLDFSILRNQQIKELIDVLDEYEGNPLEENRLLLSYNPIMSICLAAEILTKIGMSRRKFENQCKRIKTSLLELGGMYSIKIEDENFYGNLINDIDFKGRTILKIIWEKSFGLLMDENDPKAENVMLRIWFGDEATKWDGILNGYSSLTHILKSSTKKLTGSFVKIISNYFQPNFKVDYSFQYRYRSKAVSFFFNKEFYSSIITLFWYQYMWLKYVDWFTIPYLGDDTETIIENLHKSK